MKTLRVFLISIVLVSTNSIVAAATQSSINKDMFDTYTTINKRNLNHEEVIQALNDQKTVIKEKLSEVVKEISLIDRNSKDEESKQLLRTLRAQLNSLLAEHLALEFRMVASAEKTIADNLVDINNIRKRLQNSPASKEEFQKLRKQMKKNIEIGRSMKSNLIELSHWAKNDPNLRRHMHGIHRMMKNLDERIEIQKSRFPKDNLDKRTGRDSRRLDMLNRSNDRLIEELSAIKTRKEWLKVYKDRVEYNIDLFRLKRTMDLIDKSIPEMKLGNTLGSGPEREMLDQIDNLNRDMEVDTINTDKPRSGGKGTDPNSSEFSTKGLLDPDEFRNF